MLSENFHCRIFAHIMILVEMVLQLVISCECRLDTFDRTDEAEDLVLNHSDTANTSISPSNLDKKRLLNPSNEELST